MGLMDMIRHRVRSFLRLEDPIPMQIQIQRELDYTTNAAKNNIWYRGKADELYQLYHQLHGQVTSNCFWAASPSPGMEMRMIHTGMPAVIVDTLTGITAQNLDQFVFGNQAYDDLWEESITSSVTCFKKQSKRLLSSATEHLRSASILTSQSILSLSSMPAIGLSIYIAAADSTKRFSNPRSKQKAMSRQDMS